MEEPPKAGFPAPSHERNAWFLLADTAGIRCRYVTRGHGRMGKDAVVRDMRSGVGVDGGEIVSNFQGYRRDFLLHRSIIYSLAATVSTLYQTAVLGKWSLRE